MNINSKLTLSKEDMEQAIMDFIRKKHPSIASSIGLLTGLKETEIEFTLDLNSMNNDEEVEQEVKQKEKNVNAFDTDYNESDLRKEKLLSYCRKNPIIRLESLLFLYKGDSAERQMKKDITTFAEDLYWLKPDYVMHREMCNLDTISVNNIIKALIKFPVVTPNLDNFHNLLHAKYNRSFIENTVKEMARNNEIRISRDGEKTYYLVKSLDQNTDPLRVLSLEINRMRYTFGGRLNLTKLVSEIIYESPNEPMHLNDIIDLLPTRSIEHYSDDQIKTKVSGILSRLRKEKRLPLKQTSRQGEWEFSVPTKFIKK